MRTSKTRLIRITRAVTVLAVSLYAITGTADPQAYRSGEEVRKTKRIELPPQEYGDTNACTAEVKVRYYQAYDKARVAAEISNDDCAASNGSYTVRLRINKADGERETLTYEEQWARDDDRPIESVKFYDIGADVDLVSVRLTSGACACTPLEPQDQPE